MYIEVKAVECNVILETLYEMEETGLYEDHEDSCRRLIQVGHREFVHHAPEDAKGIHKRSCGYISAIKLRSSINVTYGVSR